MRRLAMATLLLTGCSGGFYRATQVEVGPATQGAQPVTPPVPRQDAPPPPEPYLTLTAFVDTTNISATSPKIDGSLQILQVNANFTDLATSQQFTSPVIARDVVKGTEYIPNGVDLLKAYPLRRDSNGNFNVTFTSHAIETNLADNFQKGLGIITSVLPAQALTPAASEAVGAATKVLGAFASNKDGTTSSVPMTLNSAQATIGQPFAFVIIPTDGSDSDVAARFNKVKVGKYALCATNAADFRLCIVGAGNRKAPLSTYAYAVFIPQLTYRISRVNFLWKKLTFPGACPFTAEDMNAYQAEIQNQLPYLTSSQAAMEREVVGSAQNLMTIRSLLTKEPAPEVFLVLSREWANTNPEGQLYELTDSAPSYKAIQGGLRDCMVTSGEGSWPGLFRAYSSGLQAIWENDPNKYEPALQKLLAAQSMLTAYSVTDESVTRIIRNNIAALGDRIFATKFSPVLAKLDSAATRGQACTDLAALLDTSCDSCKQKAIAAQQRSCPSAPPVDVATAAASASTAVAALGGAVALVKGAGDKAPVDAATISTAENTFGSLRANLQQTTRDLDATDKSNLQNIESAAKSALGRMSKK